MKISKFISCFLIFFIIFGTVGCNKDKKKFQSDLKKSNNIVKKSELTVSEEGLLKASGYNKYFIFDLQLTKNEYKWVHFWIDFYENGNKKKEILKSKMLIGELGKESNRILMAVQNCNDEEKLIISLIQDNGAISVSKLEHKLKQEFISTWQQVEKIHIAEGKDMTLAVILEKHGNSINSVPIDFFQNEEKYMNELLKNDFVYIFKCRFEKE